MASSSPSPKRRKPTAIESLTAGAISGGVARFVVAPLDVIKIRYQIQSSSEHGYKGVLDAMRSILQNEGIKAFWKGNLAAELMVIPYGAVSFVSYNAANRVLTPLIHSSNNTSMTTTTKNHLVSLLSGSFAGATATVVTYPTDLLRTRMAVQRDDKSRATYRSLSSAVVMIGRNEGIKGFYWGMAPTLIGIVPYMALQFAFYEACKAATIRRGWGGVNNSSTSIQAACGFISGVASKWITMPFDVVKKRYQISGFPLFTKITASPPSKPTNTMKATAAAAAGQGNVMSAAVLQPGRDWRKGGWLSCARAIVQTEGWRGLYRGSVPSLIKAGPNSAVTFAVYEACIRYLIPPALST